MHDAHPDRVQEQVKRIHAPTIPYLVQFPKSGTQERLRLNAGQLFTELEHEPRPGSLDALMAGSHGGPFATDLRRLSPADAATIRAASQQRYGTFYSSLLPLDAYDVIVHVPRVTPADPDEAALADAPGDVREAFSAGSRSEICIRWAFGTRSSRPSGELTNRRASVPNRAAKVRQPRCGLAVTSITAEPTARQLPGGRLVVLRSRSMKS